MVWIKLLSGKDAGPLTKAAIDALKPFRDQIHTITADNGKEFSFHEEIARKLNIKIVSKYFYTTIKTSYILRIPYLGFISFISLPLK